MCSSDLAEVVVPDIVEEEIKEEVKEVVSNNLSLDLANLALPQGSMVSVPTTKSEFKEILLYMINTGVNEYSFPYDADMLNQFKFGNLMDIIGEAHGELFDRYPEHFCYKNQITLNVQGYESGGTMTLRLENSDLSNSESKRMSETFFQEVKVLTQQLINENVITSQMTETEKARALYEWLILNLSYDTSYRKEGYTGYGAIFNKTAVCQGYIALYNSMCKLVGIDIWGVGGTTKDGTNHIWSQAVLDGRTFYIDPTFGDPVPDVKGACDFSYFGVDANFLRKTHNW